MKNKNINEILKIYKGTHQLDAVENKKVKYYINLALKSFEDPENNSYKIADCGSGYSVFIPCLTDFIKQSKLYMIDNFKSLDKFHTSNEIAKENKYKKKFLPKVNKLLKKLKIKKINLNFEKEKLKFKSNSLDLITTFHCIEHFHASPKFFINECYKALKPNGVFVVGVPNAVNFRKRISVLFGYTNYYALSEYWNYKEYYGHVREPTKAELKFFCKDAGFTNIEVYGKNFMGHERFSRIISKFIRSKKISRAISSLLLKPLEIFPGLCTDLHVICRKKPSK